MAIMCEKFSVIILILAVSTSALRCTKKIEKVKIICDDVKNVFWDDPEGARVGIGRLQTCQVKEFDTSLALMNSEIESIAHKNGTSINDSIKIEALTVSRAQCSQIPQKITNFLSNLKVAQFAHNRIRTVSKNDLKQFGGKLELIDFSSNDLTSLDADLFEYNNGLKAIILRQNPLTTIEPGFFNSLVDLENLLYVNIHSGCIRKTFYSKNHSDISKVNWKNSCNNNIENRNSEGQDC